MNEPASLSCIYRDPHDLAVDATTLAVVSFGDTDERVTMRGDVPVIHVTPIGAGFSPFFETWTTTQRRRAGQRGPLVFAHDDDHLFCAAHIPYAPHYSQRTFETYMAAFALADELGYPELFRMWNYIAKINELNDEGLEIYRDFCRGRARAFETSGKRMPSATGVGSRAGGITFYFFSSRLSRPVHVENPRQVPAYRYPARYGPKSPFFARATIIGRPAGSLTRDSLYVAGTASILGHESVHRGSVEKQSEVALDNIAHLISDANLSRYGYASGFGLKDVRLAKVYIRHAEHRDIVEDKCRAAFSESTDVRFMNLDICRQELLVEIEAII